MNFVNSCKKCHKEIQWRSQKEDNCCPLCEALQEIDQLKDDAFKYLNLVETMNKQLKAYEKIRKDYMNRLEFQGA